MRQADVNIGEVYMARVGGRRVPLQVTGLGPFGKGWTARNMVTGRVLRLRSGRRLQGAAPVSVLMELHREGKLGYHIKESAWSRSMVTVGDYWKVG